MLSLLVAADDSFIPAGFDALGAEIEHAAALPSATDIDRARPTAIIVSPAWRDADPIKLKALASRAALIMAGAPGEPHPPGGVLCDLAVAWIPAAASGPIALAALRGALRHAEAVSAGHARHDEMTELARIGVALSTERNLNELLKLILSQARRLVSADAGSLYLVDRHHGEVATTMKFTLAQNDTLPDLPFRERTVAINSRSVAGYVAVSGDPLTIEDVYEIGSDVPYHFNRAFDEQMGYRTKSMLVIPMRSHRDEIVGVLQLINRKRDADERLDSTDQVDLQVIPFDEHTVALAAALASQAAVAIENNKLYEDIQNLFEGFVMASIHTVEQRDPTTSGHSRRVTTYTMGLANALNKGLGKGPYANVRFTDLEVKELYYACLLHDFGKVTVREAVLQKEKKLYPGSLDQIRNRFVYLLQLLDIECERQRNDHLEKHGREGYSDICAKIDEHRRLRRDEMQKMLDAIIRANEPSILAEDALGELKALAARSFVDFSGTEQRLISDEELGFLSIRRGNLDERERKEIESHASQSYNFLTRIPWTTELRDIPEIVWGHHEKLNGRGYPRGIGADQLRLQTRMMTIADIFDALTASDRPYKKAVSHDRAIAILRDEAREGALDQDLLDTFIENRIWEAVADEVRQQTREARLTGAVAPVGTPSSNPKIG
jgi:HD-GYP domain-containing protein (c-di-GMP phosphodiesterase class II)